MIDDGLLHRDALEHEVDGRGRHEDRDDAVERDVRPELERGEHGDDRVDDEHELTDAEREPAREQLRDDVGAAGVAAALEDESHPQSRDRAAPQRGEQQVVAGEVRDERREHVDEHREPDRAVERLGDVAKSAETPRHEQAGSRS